MHSAGEGEEGSKEVAMLARAIQAASGGTARYKKPLFATQWLLALDGFAVSAAVCGMIVYYGDGAQGRLIIHIALFVRV